MLTTLHVQLVPIKHSFLFRPGWQVRQIGDKFGGDSDHPLVSGWIFHAQTHNRHLRLRPLAGRKCDRRMAEIVLNNMKSRNNIHSLLNKFSTVGKRPVISCNHFTHSVFHPSSNSLLIVKVWEVVHFLWPK